MSSRRSVARNATVVGVAAASFFSDLGHEMATAILPGFLTSLGAPAAALGVIEGVSDAALSASKLAGGSVADRPGVDRRFLAGSAYLTTGVAYGSFALAGAWPFIALAKGVAWAARGFRSPARDSILAGAVEPEYLGRAFGFERAGDSLGAIVGPLVAATLIGALGYRTLFVVSFVPAVLAAAAIVFLTTDVGRVGTALLGARTGMRELVRRSPRFRTLLYGVGLYGLGNFSATLLILRATVLLHDAGRSSTSAATVAVLLYAGHNAANAGAAYPAGALADREGRRPVLVAGIALFAAACFAFAFGSAEVAVLAVLFVVVGASTGMVETAQGSHAAELLTENVRGRGFGLIGLVEGVGDLVSSVTVGVLWTITDPMWGFLVAGSLAGLGACVLLRRQPRDANGT
jgi:MFS family permease